jgi:Asp-tRNA(Asn)/Glu-tRNA(Gln) amidotransferase C subunit
MIHISSEKFLSLCQQTAISIDDVHHAALKKDLSVVLNYLQSIFKAGSPEHIQEKINFLKKKHDDLSEQNFMTLRDDAPIEVVSSQDILKNSTQADLKKNFFCVPKFIRNE